MKRVYKYCDALDLPRIGSVGATSDSPAGVLVEPPGTPREFARPAPEFHLDPDRAGLFSAFAEDWVAMPPAFIVSARNVKLAGYRTYLLGDGTFFNDDSIQNPAQHEDLLNRMALPSPMNEEAGLHRVTGKDGFTLNRGSRLRQRIKGTTAVLTSDEPSNYGSWLFRTLPKIQSLRAAHFEADHYLVWREIPTFQEYLDLLGIPQDRIIDHDPGRVIYELDHAVIPGVRNNQAFLDPESAALYAELRKKHGKRQKKGMRIYVSRVAQSERGHSRAMLNERELVERLMELKFTIVDPEELSALEQISVFSQAEMVVGPSGSGMFNVVFCHPGTKVIDVESEPHWIHAHHCLFASCRTRYGFVEGKTIKRDLETHHQPWRVDIDVLIARIKDWM